MTQFLIHSPSLWNALVRWLFREQLSLLRYDRRLYTLEETFRYTVRDIAGIRIQRDTASWIRSGGLWNVLGAIDWLIWALFKNELDGEIGDAHWNPSRKDTPWIRLKWWLRNPCHNLTWHVIGFAQHDTVRIDFPTDRPEQVTSSGDPEIGWTSALTLVPTKEDTVLNWVNLYPYIQYHGLRVTFYLGWRGRGTFGVKLNLKLTRGE